MAFILLLERFGSSNSNLNLAHVVVLLVEGTGRLCQRCIHSSPRTAPMLKCSYMTTASQAAPSRVVSATDNVFKANAFMSTVRVVVMQSVQKRAAQIMESCSQVAIRGTQGSPTALAYNTDAVKRAKSLAAVGRGASSGCRRMAFSMGQN